MKQLFRFNAQDGFSWRIKPSHNSLLINRNDPRRDRLQERFRKRLLYGDLLVKKSVLQDGRDLFRQSGQAFQIGVIERLSGHAMSKENPADNAGPCVKGRNHFGSAGIESAAQEYALILIFDLGEIGAR